MELFQKAVTVKLSRKDKYLTAQEDEESVFLERKGSSLSSIWIVEQTPGDNFLRLKSCYGKYLTATNTPFLPGATARKVTQTQPEKHDASIQWEPIRDGFSARFRTQNGHFLRPNGGLPPWRNTVTHDLPQRMLGTQEKLLWDIDVVEMVPKSPGSSHNFKSNSSNVVFPPNARPPPMLGAPKTGKEDNRKKE